MLESPLDEVIGIYKSNVVVEESPRRNKALMKKRPKTATGTIEKDSLESPTDRGRLKKLAATHKKRKKSVHFPEDHVIPIDDSDVSIEIKNDKQSDSK